MQNYNYSSEVGRDLIFKYIKERMKELRITQKKLSELIDVNESTLVRNFKKETVMDILTFLKICGALDINPYLIPKENDPINKENRIHFN